MTPTPENALPNYDKRVIEDPAAFFRTLFHLRDIKEERAIPAIVTDYDAKTGEVTVLPMAKYTFDTRDGEAETDRETVKVRALKICHGGYSISLPIFKGDTGWLIAGDRRCGTAIEKNGEILVCDLTDEELKDKTAKPDDCSLLNFENGFFIPFSWNVESIGDEESLIIRNVSKDEKLNLSNNHGVYEKYPWSMIEIQRDGNVNVYGGGTKFSIREKGLYLNDKLTFTHGNGLNTIIGSTKDSVPIAGDVEIVGADENIEVKTEIVDDSSESKTKKSRMTIKIVGGGGTPIEDATAEAETLDPGSDATASVEWDDESKLLNFSFGIPRGPKGDKGNDGDKGEDGDTITDITAGTPTVSAGTTTTPVTVAMSKSGSKTFNVVSQNGVSASGSDYIDVDEHGVVSAKVPTDGSKGLVTTDKNLKIGGNKTFTNSVLVENTSNGQGRYWPNAIYFKPPSSKINTWIAFYDGIDGVTIGQLRMNTASGELVLGAYGLGANATLALGHDSNDKPYHKLGTKPDDKTSTTSRDLMTFGNANDKFLRIANLKSSDGSVTITPNDTTKEVDFKINFPSPPDPPTIPAITVEGTIGSNQAVGSIEVDSIDKHKLKITGVNIPAAPQGAQTWTVDGSPVTVNASVAKTIKSNVQSDWNATSGDSVILNKPTLATVATSGDYNDLANKPTIPAEQVNADWDATSGKAQILNKPTIPSAPQGSDYIEVSSTGVISAKNLVTTDTRQSISGLKTFTEILKVAYDSSEATLYPNALYLKAKAGGNSWVAFFNPSNQSKVLSEIIQRGGVLELLNTSDGNGILLNAAADKTKLNNDPTVGTDDKSQKLVATTSWVNKKYNVAELIEGDNITITPDENDPKKLKIAATQPTSLKSPYSLTIKKYGSTDVVYDGSEAKEITIPTPEAPPVTSVSGSGSGISVSPTTGAVVVKNTGVTKLTQSGCATVSGETGEVTIGTDIKTLTFTNGTDTLGSYDGSADKSITLNTIEIQEGDGIRLDKDGNVITITNTRKSGDEQVQSDWDQADSTKKDFIKNKPTIFALSSYVNFIADMRYNTDTHCFQKLVGHIAIDGTVTIPDGTVDMNWTNMTGGETTPLSEEV